MAERDDAGSGTDSGSRAAGEVGSNFGEVDPGVAIDLDQALVDETGAAAGAATDDAKAYADSDNGGTRTEQPTLADQNFTYDVSENERDERR